MTLKTDFETAQAALLRAAESHVTTDGKRLGEKLEDTLQILVDWLDFIENNRLTGTANELITGTRASLIELTAAISLGLARACTSLIRAEIDMILSWLFYKDHPYEWWHLNNIGSTFMQHSDLLRYLNTYIPKFQFRLNKLREASAFSVEPFKLLSQFVHSQNVATMPAIREIEKCIDASECEHVLEIQACTTEFLNDVLLAFYGDEYATLPKSAVSGLESRLGEVKFGKYRKGSE